MPRLWKDARLVPVFSFYSISLFKSKKMPPLFLIKKQMDYSGMGMLNVRKFVILMQTLCLYF